MIKENLREAGYVKAEHIADKVYKLTNAEGVKEIWYCNKYHASYGITYNNTHLEFGYTLR